MGKIECPNSQIRVYSIAHQNFDGYQDLGNCLLSQLVEDISDRIVAVKVDDELLSATQDQEYNFQAYFSQLHNLNLGACTEVLLASGSTVYMSDPEMVSQVRDRFFASQADHCCRYGALLVSSCLEGVAELEQPTTVKIVDFEHELEVERKVAADLRTGDCHGKISPRLAKLLGGEENRPFQFRLANANLFSDLPAFIAKGTVAVDRKRTENRGYDLVLDRSSIKGWASNSGPMKVSQVNNQWRLVPKPNLNQQQRDDLGYLPAILQKHKVNYRTNPSDQSYTLYQPSKEALDTLANAYDWGIDRIACGVYQMPGLVIGNNANAQIQDYRNSWQLMQWYSPQAIEQDIVPFTVAEAEHLRSLQNDYRLLATYLVENYDRKKRLIDSEDEPTVETSEPGLIEVLRADTKGELAGHPKIVSFCKEQLRRCWTELATKGANTLESAMAQPADIKRGTIIAPHLKNGTEVIVTRYPIINKDNIRRYLVDNDQIPELTSTKGCVFINPADAMKYHQCDFDGDQLVCTPCDLFPTIAAETRTARIQLDSEGNDLNRDFNPVVKKEKQAYPQSDLRHMALAVRLNSIGRMANAIGRVNCAQPNPEADLRDQKHFVAFKQELMDVLFDALQIEVDSPKSATRYNNYYPTLDQQLNSPAFALPFFDFKQDNRLYNSAPMPIPENVSVVDILPQRINQIWENSELKEMNAYQYNYLLQPKPDVLDERSQAIVKQLSLEILRQYQDTVKSLFQDNVASSQEIQERFARTYSGIKNQIVMAQLSSTAKDELAATLWQKQHHKGSEAACRRKCIDICRHFDPSIYTYQTSKHQFQRDLIRNQPAYIVEAPFESSLFAAQGRKDCAVYIKEMLEAYGQAFEATVHPSKPCIVFAIKDISPNVKQLFEPFHDPDIARHHDQIDVKKASQSLSNQNRALYKRLFTFRAGIEKQVPLVITAPRHMNWVLGQNTRKASLVFSVLPERITQALGREVTQVKLVGKDKNAYAQHDFNSNIYQGREHNFLVSPFNDPNSDRHGDPIVYMQHPGDGNYYSLALFAQDSNKLPISASFIGQVFMNNKGVDLFIKPGSTAIPEKKMPQRPEKPRSKARRQKSTRTTRDNQTRMDRIFSKRNHNQQLFRQSTNITHPNLAQAQTIQNQLEI